MVYFINRVYIPVSPRPRDALVRILRVHCLLFLRLLVHLAVAVHAVALLVAPESWLIGEELRGEGEDGRVRVCVCVCVWCVGVRGRKDSVSGGEGQPLERAWLIMGAARLAGDTPTRRTSHPGCELIGWACGAERPCRVARNATTCPALIQPQCPPAGLTLQRMPHAIPTPEPIGRECTFGTRGTVPGTATLFRTCPNKTVRPLLDKMENKSQSKRTAIGDDARPCGDSRAPRPTHTPAPCTS